MTRKHILRCDKCGKEVQWSDPDNCPAADWGYLLNKDLCSECHKGWDVLFAKCQKMQLDYLGIAQKGGG